MSRLTRWLRSHWPGGRSTYRHLSGAARFEIRTERLLGRPFRIPDAASFCAGYREVFVDEMYRFHARDAAPRIVDGGANCGLTVAYFKQLYPAARITAVEADPEIFGLLQENIACQGWRDVTPIHAAVFAAEGPVTFHRQGADAGRVHALSTARGTVEVPTIQLDDLLTEPVDMLKLDIEGAETEVLCACQRLDRVRQMMVEYHSFSDAGQSLHRMLEKLSACGFRYYLRTQFCTPRPLVDDDCYLDMDLQINVFARRPAEMAAARAA